MYITNILWKSVKCSNRTFMELKLLLAFSRLRACLRSNRTFMELKSIKRLLSPSRRCVLIAPLWNWNGAKVRAYSLGIYVLIAPLWNWNILRELTAILLFRSNRTFMELKWSSSITFATFARRSNRTFMELKLCCLLCFA